VTLIEPKIELWYDAQWNDVTSDVRTEAGGGGITIEKSDRDPDTAQVTFDNRDGKYSPRNPLSTLYGKIGRNTPIRIGVPALGGSAQERFAGKVVSWPPLWDASENNGWVTVECAAIRHRLGQGQKPLDSALRRAHKFTSPIAYWPLERGTISSGLIGGQAARVSHGQFATSSDDTLVGSDELIQVTGGAQQIILGTVPEQIGLTAWTVAVWGRVNVPAEAENLTGGTVTMSVRVGGSDIGQVAVAHRQNISDLSGENFLIDAYDTDGVLIDDLSSTESTMIGTHTDEWRFLRITVDTSSGDLRIRYWVDEVLQETFTDAGHSVGYPMSVSLGSFVTSGTTDIDVSTGHLSVWGDAGTSASDIYTAGLGHVGETAGARFTRLTAEEDITSSITGTSSITQPMGPQRQLTLLELLQECADADGGILYELRSSGGLTMRTGRNLVTKSLSPFEIPYTSILPTLQPLEDDQGTRNDITVSRPGGGSYRTVQTTGPLNTSDPEDDVDGVGIYDESIELNLEADTQLRGSASLRLSIGTQDEPRYSSVRTEPPGVTVDNLGDMNPGVFVKLTGLPKFLPPNDSLQRVRAWTETIDVVQHILDLELIPGEVYRAGELEQTTRLSPAGCITESAFIAGTNTSLTVERVVSTTRPWITSADRSEDFPFDIMVSGVRLTVTAISGSSDPQTMTVTQTPVNGIEKVVPVGSSVTLAEPWRLAR
jgi:hypothetical protein